MASEEQFALRTWQAQVERAHRIARKMQRLPRYELLGVTKTAVLRLALVDGLEVAEQAERRYFREEAAARLIAEIDGGVEVSGMRLPIINSLNVMLTPSPYSDRLFAQGIVNLHNHRFGTGKEVLINMRLPRLLKRRLDKVVREILAGGPPPEMESASATLRLLLEIGLFWMDYKVFWKTKSAEDSTPDAPTPLP